MKELSGKRYLTSTLLLVVEFVLLSALIIYKSITSTTGYISADSTSYLSLAQNLLQGHGFHTAGFGLTPGSDKQYFAVWPVGYPVLIYLFSLIFKTSVFWSSKIINVICLAAIFLLIKKIANKNSWIVALTFFLFPVLELFTYSWSEIPFVTSFFFLLFFTDRYINANKTWTLAPIFICALAMFLFRYIGYMSVPLLFFVALILLLRKEYKRGVSLGVVAAVVALLIFLYLQHNKAMTGYMTGMDRVPARETIVQFIIMLVVGFYLQFEFIYSINFLPIIIAIAAVLVYKGELLSLFRKLFSKTRWLNPGMRDLLFIGSIGYFLLLVYNRKQAFFDNLNMRLLAPGLIMLFVVLTYYVTLRLRKSLYLLAIPLTVVALASYLVSTAVLLYKKKEGEEIGYNNFVQQVSNRYNAIPQGSVVLCANRHIGYLRTDLVIAFPHYAPFNNDTETWTEFIARVKSQFPQKKVYLLAEDGEGMHPSFDKSIKEFVPSHPANKLFEF